MDSFFYKQLKLYPSIALKQGKSVRLKLKVFSSFSEEMITDSVTTKPANGQFSFKHTVANGRSTITPSEKSFVGYVTFDPAAECREHEDCYTGFPITSKRKPHAPKFDNDCIF